MTTSTTSPATLPGRRARRARGWSAAVAATVILAACGSHPRVAAIPTTLPPPPPPPTQATTTTTRPKPAPTAPLTGLVQPSRVQLVAPAVVVKIDNVDPARPQTGINQADVVYEEMVEGGLSRLAAVFQSQYPTTVGPVRSGRLTDEGIADDLHHPVLAYSGTNALFLPILRAQPVTDVDGDNHPTQFWRSNLAPAPHNLYASVASLAATSTTHTPPPALFAYLPAGSHFSGTGLAPAVHLGLSFPNARVTWDWSAAAHLWLRGQDGTPDVDRTGVQLSTTNVVVQFVPYITSGIATGEGGPPAPIPEGLLVGSGPVWYFSNGQVVKGSWTRSSLTTTTRYVDATGAPMHLSPGRTWVELAPVGVTPTVLP